MRTAIGVLAAFLLALPVAAWAGDEPILAPTRDVTVTYRVTPAKAQSGSEKMTLSYSDHNRRVRMDFYSDLTQEEIGSIIYDQPGGRVLTLVPSRHIYYTVPAKGRANPGLLLNREMRYTRTGTATIAGLPCTEWKVSNGRDFQGSACVTSDGVALKATRNAPNPETLEAVKVTYGALPTSLFEPGPDYKPAPSH